MAGPRPGRILRLALLVSGTDGVTGAAIIAGFGAPSINPDPKILARGEGRVSGSCRGEQPHGESVGQRPGRAPRDLALAYRARRLGGALRAVGRPAHRVTH